ncbi:MAG: Lrp/AsnC family transcriptional regulator [Thermoprotei archaeon]|nr:MAG: Lrp/AsnC family transcriptional regulator [Thermoprotei archaeon]RLF03531.1 MAG: Lrp/AsnC family transcriptional regulator [Thermoprotei archaeon]
MSVQIKLDKLDVEILRKLMTNSRTSVVKIARSIGAPRTTVIGRIERLVNQGIIRSFTVKIDHSKVGYNFLAFVLVRAKRGSFTRSVSAQVMLTRKVLEESKKKKDLPWVEEAHIITGEYDILFKVRAKNWDEITRFLIEFLAGMEEVEHTNTLLVLTTISEEMNPPLEKEI